ncbi:MAG: hypothetical protein H6712_19345 [Myxococcales bacterium]|nr:hypothetical protein [Myxococcales bacterium]MCB9716031.1 hypothetical protein [Myxococcales bacterium]
MILDHRFNGPPGSANGGNACGCFAEALGLLDGVDPGRPFLLGQMTAAVPAGIPGNRRYVVHAWPTGGERREHLAAAALTDDEGRVWARAEHVWIELERP